MKKLLLTAFAACAMFTSSMARVWTTYVDANVVNDIKAAINEEMSAGDVHTVMLCKKVNATKDGIEEAADGTCKANIGKAAMQAVGTLILKSTATDIDDLPQLYISFQTFPVIDKNVGLPSLVVEGINLDDSETVGGGGYIFSHKTADNTYGMDSCVFRNCSIKSGRAIFREENQGGTTLEEAQKYTNYYSISETRYCTPHTIKKFVFEKNKCHEMDIDASNNWRPFYFVAIPEEIHMSDNMFYDMPYAQHLISFHKTAVSEGQTANWYIHNNTFLMSSMSADNDSSVTKKFTLINAGAWVSAQTNFQVYNNLFLGQTEGLYAAPSGATEGQQWCPYSAKPSATSRYDGNAAKLLNCIDADGNPAGYLTCKGNYFSKYYDNPARIMKITEEAPDTTAYEYDLIELNCEGMTWTNDKFRGADKSKFNVLKTDEFYTAGVSYVEDINSQKVFDIPTYVGAGIMYVDEFAQEATISAEIEGETYGTASVTIEPSKEIYKVGDEVTLTAVSTACTALNKFDNFLGWYKDGVLVSTDKSMKVTFTEAEEYKYTAKFEKSSEIGNILAAWYTSTGKDMQDIAAQIGTGMLYGVGADTLSVSTYAEDAQKLALQTAELPYVAKAFQTRTGKFGEDAAADRVCTYQLRTAAAARDYNRDYAVMKLNTKGKINVVATFYRGTDSNASKMQYTYWSTDSTNWTKLEDATLDMSTVAREVDFSGKTGQLFGWGKVVAALPEACNGQEAVYVKIQGAVAGAPETADDIVFNTPAGFADFEAAHNSDVFEYISNIVVTADNFDVSAIDNTIKMAQDTIANGSLSEESAVAFLNKAIEQATAAKDTVATQAGIDAVVANLKAAISSAFYMQIASKLTAFTDGEKFILDDYTSAGTAAVKTGTIMGDKVAAVGGTDLNNATNKGTSTIDGTTYNNSARLKNASRVLMFKVAQNSEVTVYGQSHSSRVFCAGTEIGKDDLGQGTKSTATFTFTAPANTPIYVSSVNADDATLAGGDLYVAGFTVKAAAVKGDVNGDGEVNIADVNAVISVMCGDDTFKASADVNGDGSINIADVNAVITIMCGGTVE